MRAPRSSTLLLQAKAASTYVAMLRRLVAVARPGAAYPDPRQVDAHLSFLDPCAPGTARSTLEIDPQTGWPTFREWVHVSNDQSGAGDFLKEHGRRLSERVPYYEALARASVFSPSQTRVRLVSQVPTQRYEIVHDAYDVVLRCLVRLTVLLTQREGDHIELRKDYATLGARVRRTVERCAGADAELAFILLSDLEGLELDSVQRGQLGPLHFRGVDGPALLAPIFEATPGAFVLHLALERAGRDLPEDRPLDPFSALYRESLTAEARAAVEERRGSLGYRVVKERRLICTPNAEKKLRALLAEHGTPLIVRAT